VRGDGRVTCSKACTGVHRLGSILTLTARPAANYDFDQWSGACIGVVPSCPVALDRSAALTASFVGEPRKLVVSVGGPGEVRSSPPGIDCGAANYLCTLSARFGSVITLTPTANGDGRFEGWDGAYAQAGSGACTLEIDNSGPETAAAFGHSAPLPGDQPLTITPPGAHVTSQPAGIDCPLICTALFTSGTLVTLHLSDYGQWGGACRGSDLDRCAIVVDAPTDVDIAPPPPPPEEEQPSAQIDLTVSGPGVIRSSDGGLHCGRSRQAQTQCGEVIGVGGGRVIRLMTRARAGAHFARWGGACRRARLVCTLQPQNQQVLQVTALFRSQSLPR
jgi:hypothetical protein